LTGPPDLLLPGPGSFGRVASASSPAFRIARACDVPAVVALVESAYRGESSRAGWTTEADLLEGCRTDAAHVTELIERPASVVVLLENGRGLVGCFHFERRDPSTAYFGMFAVAPTEQGAGLGRAALFEARRLATGWGCRTIDMTVLRQRDDLIAWYERHGFRATGATVPFPYGDDSFGRPRRDDLEFVVLSGPV